LEFYDVTMKGTYGRAVARLRPALTALIPALLLAAGLPAGGVRAAIDVAGKVRVDLVARPGSASGAGQDFTVRDGGVMRSGDGVQLRLESDADVYVTIVAYGSSDTAMLLHPFSARPGDALIRQGRKKVIPEAGVFLPLDDQEGRETLFIIISKVPLTDVSDLLPRMEAHGDDLSAITAMINAAYPRARRLTFKHIGARPLVGVAATTLRASPSWETPSPTAKEQNSDSDPYRVGGVSLLPPASDGWSVPSTQGFGTSDATATGAATGAATAAVGASADDSTSSGASSAATESTPGAAGNVQANAAAASEAASAPVSSALRKARQAAGIDERRFQGILSTLPDSGQADVPESIRKPYKEQGVLSAAGNRIRALRRAPLESSASWPGDDDGSQNRVQN